VVITPEGTRKFVKQWKRGFYLIAMDAKVPIILSFIDYRDKTGGIGPVFYPTGDYNKDMEFIYQFYSSKTARHPENFFVPPNIQQGIS
jgi:1-acyl-sn-glycerol-3-phosphate acyltransferase